ncbi:MAG: Cys-Cys-COOH (seleno)protein SaoC [Clostridium sp.]
MDALITRGIKYKLILFIGICLLFIVGCSNEGESKKEAISVKNTSMLQYFKDKNPKVDVISVKEGDLNSDSFEDMIVMFKHNKDGKEEVAFTVVIKKENGYETLKHYRAPIENQKIEVKNIDNKPPVEFSISGSKNGEVGLSIYRLEGNKIIDIFGLDSMDAC